MASIFTFDPDPPRVSSPWGTPSRHTPTLEAASGGQPSDSSSNGTVTVPDESDVPFTRLEAEQEEGPTEYKLHLLLRPRRAFSASTTAARLPRALRWRSTGPIHPPSPAESTLSKTPPPSSTSSTRQNRLEQLTTQLLWRLQQSSPFHSSANTLILPSLPVATPQLHAPTKLAKLLPGLEESQGALYEIGVADDGTLVGLAHDEMEESLGNLRAMAASLGCSVEVLRKLSVGRCEWFERPTTSSDDVDVPKYESKLWVAEAYVRPGGNGNRASPRDGDALLVDKGPESISMNDEGQEQGRSGSENASEQLRISLTGPTMSGKSSLLGSLTTATLDNGRGKSRLSLLKHRHEIATGMTSSVTQELIGYRHQPQPNGASVSMQVINYASGNVSSWNDIHATTGSGRLAFLSDSAGHPRYRRTTVRGLIGWAPHWTLLCIAADSSESTSGKSGSTPSSQEILGTAAAVEVDFADEHVDLCLTLGSPLAVVITKLDLASRNGLRHTLSKLLSRFKEAGRKPVILSDAAVASTDLAESANGDPLLEISSRELDGVALVTRQMGKPDDDDGTNSTRPIVVPIVLTSAVNGTGVRKLHALLSQLPIPLSPGSAQDPGGAGERIAPPSPLFHIEDVYSKFDSTEPFAGPSSASSTLASPTAYIVSGHLRYGTVRVGDELLLGPHPIEGNGQPQTHLKSTETTTQPTTSSLEPEPTTESTTSRSYPGALHARLPFPSFTTAPSPTSAARDWRRVRVVSIRHLRLPVSALRADRVGTLGLAPVPASIPSPSPPPPPPLRIRKGMVVTSAGAGTDAGGPPRARRAFVARFRDPRVRGLAVGSAVVAYVASVRAGAKVIAVALAEEEEEKGDPVGPTAGSDDDASAGSSGEEDDGGDRERGGGSGGGGGKGATLLTLQFLASREFVETGAKALVMPGGPGLVAKGTRGERGVSGLQGFVGSVVEGLG